ncbi:hypothetical protein QFZ94_000313 [Paraburkholderia sp. JPY465]|uniref:transposase n=1 Tax=Paraburkholderia sp. JPY465 TaxID=3042285 RepID=UPI003D22A0A1
MHMITKWQMNDGDIGMTEVAQCYSAESIASPHLIIWLTGRLHLIAAESLVDSYEANYPKTTGKIPKDRDALLQFYDFPVVHWQPVRTTNPIASTFAMACHRTRRTSNCPSRATCVGMVVKRIETEEVARRKIRSIDKIEALLKGISFERRSPVIESTPRPHALVA